MIKNVTIICIEYQSSSNDRFHRQVDSINRKYKYTGNSSLLILTCLEIRNSTTDTARYNTAISDCNDELITIPESAVLTGSKVIYKIRRRELYLNPDLSAKTSLRLVHNCLYPSVVTSVFTGL